MPCSTYSRTRSALCLAAIAAMPGVCCPVVLHLHVRNTTVGRPVNYVRLPNMNAGLWLHTACGRWN